MSSGCCLPWYPLTNVHHAGLLQLLKSVSTALLEDLAPEHLFLKGFILFYVRRFCFCVFGLFWFLLLLLVCISVYVPCGCPVSSGARKGDWIPWNWIMVAVSHYVSHHVGPVRVASAHASRATSAAQNTLPEENTFFLPAMADTYLLRNLLPYFYGTHHSWRAV